MHEIIDLAADKLALAFNLNEIRIHQFLNMMWDSGRSYVNSRHDFGNQATFTGIIFAKLAAFENFQVNGKSIWIWERFKCFCNRFRADVLLQDTYPNQWSVSGDEQLCASG